MDNRRGRRFCSNPTRGASAKARIAAIEIRMSERATCAAAHRITAVRAIQARMTSGMAIGLSHFAPELKSNRQITGRAPLACASAIEACEDEREMVLSLSPKRTDLPQFGQKVATSGQLVLQCIQYILIPPIPCFLNT